MTLILIEPLHDKTNKMTWTPIEDSDQPWHLPSLTRVFTVRIRNLGSLATHQAHLVGFVMWRLNLENLVSSFVLFKKRESMKGHYNSLWCWKQAWVSYKIKIAESVVS